MRRDLFNSKGQAIVEFAIILPLFLLLMFGMMQFGLVLHDYISVSEAAREGARHAIVGSTIAMIRDKVKAAAPTLDKDKLVITISPEQKRIAGEPVTVTVKAPIRLSLPMVSEYVPTEIQSSAVMRMEKDVTETSN